jgi:hypothetical protein
MVDGEVDYDIDTLPALLEKNTNTLTKGTSAKLIASANKVI